jgi:hypothetical protein
MAKAKKLTAEELVSQYLHQLDYPLESVVAALRKIVLQTDKEISEQLKWNSLAFYYNGQMKPSTRKNIKRISLFLIFTEKTLFYLFFQQEQALTIQPVF